MNKGNFSFVSLGCARSLVDSEKMIGDLQNGGFKLVAEGSNEAITVLNTCSFIQAAIQETEENIAALIEKKKAGHIRYLVVTGCYPSRFKRQELVDRYPEVDLWFSTKEESQLASKLTQIVFERKFQPVKNAGTIKLTPKHFAYLKISEGCNNWCAFCTIPKIRGEHTSKPLDAILAEARHHIALGAKELVLIAEDTTCWGEDLFGKPSLPLLLNALCELPIDWIRLMYIFPPRVNAELIETIQKQPKICRYIDMPVQHISSEILDAMRRRHDRKFLEKVLQEFREAIPDLALRTTFILGFPGETEAHVDELIAFIQENPFAQLGCFTYSHERETRAARLPNPVTLDVARQRVSRVMETQYALLQDIRKAWIGETVPLLYEGNGFGRTFREAPEVDSKVILEGDSSKLVPGEFYSVTLTGIKRYDMTARLSDA